MPSCNERFEFDLPEQGAPTGGSAGAEQVVSNDGTGGTATSPSRCVNDTDCVLAELVCDPARGRCIECNSNADCQRAEQPRCDAALQRCVACLVDDDCPSGWECDVVERRCVQTCNELRDCASEAHACHEGRCLACDHDIECRDLEGAVCSRSGLACVTCRDDAQCPPELSCDVLSGRCVECVTTSDCPEGSVCHPTELVCTSG